MLGGAEPAYSRAGHGLGVDMTESPSLTVHDETPLEPGMVLCLEPNGHWPRAGWLCAEEEVVVTADGHELLSPVFPSELAALG
jgi:Xaa-Pro aminopeptidase